MFSVKRWACSISTNMFASSILFLCTGATGKICQSIIYCSYNIGWMLCSPSSKWVRFPGQILNSLDMCVAKRFADAQAPMEIPQNMPFFSNWTVHEIHRMEHQVDGLRSSVAMCFWAEKGGNEIRACDIRYQGKDCTEKRNTSDQTSQ